MPAAAGSEESDKRASSSGDATPRKISGDGSRLGFRRNRPFLRSLLDLELRPEQLRD
jgi:hypothetical protein